MGGIPEPGGYLIISKDKIGTDGKVSTEIVGVIQKPLLKREDGSISYNCFLNFLKIDEETYIIQFDLDSVFFDKNSVAFIAFEMRREKQPDNALYSNLPNMENSYLSNYSIIGNSTVYGIGRLMVRYVFVKNFNLHSNQIKDVSYYTYNLNNHNEQFELLPILEDWCSMTGNWNNNYLTGNRIAFLLQNEQELKFDITEEVKKWCDDTKGQMERNGLQLKTAVEKEDEYNILLSNDNSLFRNRTEIHLK